MLIFNKSETSANIANRYMTDKAVEYTQLKPEQTIIFIGMMGAGKTTIGKALAREIGRDFIDLDHEIVRRCGVAIPTIFDIEGVVMAHAFTYFIYAIVLGTYFRKTIF